MKAVLHVDGGSRGNPGPAAIGVVIDRAGGERLAEISEPIGVATNNVAEYTAMIRGLARALELGADEVEVIGDSELVVKQVNGVYKVKHAAMRPLFLETIAALRAFRSWSVRSVPRAQNVDADALVNAALDAQASSHP